MELIGIFKKKLASFLKIWFVFLWNYEGILLSLHSISKDINRLEHQSLSFQANRKRRIRFRTQEEKTANVHVPILVGHGQR